jgi:hypothetical protein
MQVGRQYFADLRDAIYGAVGKRIAQLQSVNFVIQTLWALMATVVENSRLHYDWRRLLKLLGEAL